MKALVTGGAGFLGSHLVDQLLVRGHQVTVIDNLSQGILSNLARAKRSSRFSFVKGDVTNDNHVKIITRDCDTIFHLAAKPEVRNMNSRVQFDQNLHATYCILEAAVRNKVREFVFTSSSTVYGEASVIPTPETYAPLLPISAYGTFKLASEALVAGYCSTHRMKGVIFRLANIVGSRARRGVVIDFVKKLRSDKRRLEVLGDGAQIKSYLSVEDCVEAIMRVQEADAERFEVYNLGSTDAIDVDTVAEVVSRTMGLPGARLIHTGGVDGGRGWLGDVKRMWLDISKLKTVGWIPSRDSAESVRQATRLMIRND